MTIDHHAKIKKTCLHSLPQKPIVQYLREIQLLGEEDHLPRYIPSSILLHHYVSFRIALRRYAGGKSYIYVNIIVQLGVFWIIQGSTLVLRPCPVFVAHIWRQLRGERGYQDPTRYKLVHVLLSSGWR